MNMIATKPVRYLGLEEQIGAVQRLVRLAAAWTRLGRDRREGRAPEPAPRTPEQAAALTGSPRPKAPSG